MESTIEKSSFVTTPLAARSKSPVFVLGCPRSGTTVLYHMLLSAGNFAVYRAESNVFSVLQPRFGNLRSASNRRQLLSLWLHSRLFQVTGLDAEDIREKIMRDCHSAGDFLRIVMEETARQQGVERWADCTPDHLLYIPQIKRQIPDALVVHIIRDGRDVALSYVQQGWAYPFAWDRKEHLSVAGLFWEWIVRRGREYGRALGPDYYELHYEDLVEKPQQTLRALGEFVGQELDYDKIQQVGIGSVSEPNTSFSSDSGGAFNPIGRWEKKMTADQLADFEILTGNFLQELGYPLSSAPGYRDFRSLRLRSTYLSSFAGRHWLKSRTPLGRLAKLERMEISENSGAHEGSE
jgi:Sulfotransferase family